MKNIIRHDLNLWSLDQEPTYLPSQNTSLSNIPKFRSQIGSHPRVFEPLFFNDFLLQKCKLFPFQIETATIMKFFTFYRILKSWGGLFALKSIMASAEIFTTINSVNKLKVCLHVWQRLSTFFVSCWSPHMATSAFVPYLRQRC